MFGGWKKDPDDPQDARFAWRKRPLSSVPVRKSVNLWTPSMEIRTQAFNDCTGQAGAYAMRMALHTVLGRDPGELSPLYLYALGRAVWGGQHEDEGSYLRTLFSAIKVQGACTEEAFPYDDHGPFDMPGWKQIKNGFKHRGLRSYRRVYTPHEAREALSEGFPLVGGWNISEAFAKWRGPEPFDQDSGPPIGGHAMAVCGYEGDNFILPNSAGTYRGERGFWRVTENWLMQSDRLYACDTSVVR